MSEGYTLNKTSGANTPKLLVVGADDLFFQKVYEHLLSQGLSVAYYFSHYPLSRESSITVAARIDVSCFYQSSQVSLAAKINKRAVIDEDYLTSMLECERYFMLVMDRLSAKSQSIRNRKVLFRELLGFFKAFFEENTDITHVFFPRTPHFGWDVVLFFVAKHLGINTLILQRTDLNRFHLIRTDWRYALDLVKLDNNEVHWSADEINTMLQGDSEFVKYSKSLNSHINQVSARRNVLRYSINALRFIFRWTRLPIHLWKTRDKPWTDSAFFCNERVSFSEKYYLYIKRYLDNKKYLSAYKHLSVIPDLNVPYIYCAMHFQPERSTQPEGMGYEDLFLAISMLSAALPSGWLIYVKEHPRQFDSWPPDLRKMNARSVNYYNEIAAIPGVKFVPVDFNSHALISNSRIASTITGSTGWEALKSGKPAIILGYSWYSACESCAVVRNVEDARLAVSSLSKKNSDEVNRDCHNFLLDLQPHLISSFPGAFLYKEAKENYQGFVVSLAKGIIERVQGKVPAL